MRGSRTLAAVLVFLLAMGTTAAGCEGTDAVAQACLDRAHVATVGGAQAAGYSAGDPFPAEGTIDARGATWTLAEDYPLYLRTGAGPNVCVVGGSVTHSAPHATTTWDEWHANGAGVLTKSAGSTFVGTEVHNVGDGFNIATADSAGFLLQGVRASQVHDDCVQDDDFHSGTIDDSLMDGCYVFLSARKGGLATPLDAFDEKVLVTRSLIRLAAMPDTYLEGFGPPGHGPVWKMGSGGGPGASGISPRIGMHDTIIRIDGDSIGGGSVGVPTVDHDLDGRTPPVSYLDASDCSNNTIVWSGGTPGSWVSTYPSSCFTITTDLSVWDDAVAAWEADHP